MSVHIVKRLSQNATASGRLVSTSRTRPLSSHNTASPAAKPSKATADASAPPSSKARAFDSTAPFSKSTVSQLSASNGVDPSSIKAVKCPVQHVVASTRLVNTSRTRALSSHSNASAVTKPSKARADASTALPSKSTVSQLSASSAGDLSSVQAVRRLGQSAAVSTSLVNPSKTRLPHSQATAVAATKPKSLTSGRMKKEPVRAPVKAADQPETSRAEAPIMPQRGCVLTRHMKAGTAVTGPVLHSADEHQTCIKNSLRPHAQKQKQAPTRVQPARKAKKQWA